MGSAKVPTIKLSSGFNVPLVGLGTWKAEPGVVGQTVRDAIDVGYRHFDCALIYQNEKEIGEALNAKIKEGVVKREDLFITSKLWNTFHKPELVVPSLKKTLADLGLEYVDLYLMHWPMAFQEGGDLFPKDANDKVIYSDVDYLDTWKALEECLKLGLVKSLGVSNFNSEQIQRILDNGTVKPVMNQVECHPYLNQKKLQDFCKTKGIVLTAYSPLGSPDRPWATPADPKLVDDPKLVELSKKYGKSPAQIVFRWLVQREIIAIPKTVNKGRLVENQSVFDFTLADEDMDYLYTLNRPNGEGRIIHLAWNKDHKYFPFGIEY